ncbi:nucleotide-binding domain-containing protein [Photobacterium salinisoli]|uniref:nucleotide-binding domain-containing protein n=1 Tax=Photobacterium salinisoli TaxID=1616783 RepID=UPI000EA1ECDE|nr:adenylate/guanylate cyclase domain-containing protein [Photobacterium salinisoli]
MSKNTFKTITDGYFSDFARKFSSKRRKTVPGLEGFINESEHFFEHDTQDVLKSSLDIIAPPEYTYQSLLRPLFGKSGINSSKVGAHPDFERLRESGDIEHHNIVTMFVDIKRSSRLALLMTLEETYMVKNRILQTCVDVVRSLDGYPHRLMGDALMAYFGGRESSSEDAIANAINAASTLKFVLSEYVFPSLNEITGNEIKLGVRIGLDFGDDDEIIWANYGYGQASEVTALGIPVDLASKAQSQAKKNTAMLGQGILKHIDFPDAYSEIKIVEKSGVLEEERYILPNMQKSDGTKLNRICRLLRMDDYQYLLPFSQSEKKGSSTALDLIINDSIRFYCQYRLDDNSPWSDYPSVSFFLEKGMNLRFVVEVLGKDIQAYGDLIAVFTKTNHGKQARDKNEDGAHSSSERLLVNQPDGYNFVVSKHEEIEKTAYRGLHTMEVKVYPKSHKNLILFQDVIGVYIK